MVEVALTAPEDLRCSDVVELVTAYLEGALAAPEHTRFEHHLASCSGCLAYLAQVRATLRIVGTLRADDVPEPLMTALVDAFRAAR